MKDQGQPRLTRRNQARSLRPGRSLRPSPTLAACFALVLGVCALSVPLVRAEGDPQSSAQSRRVAELIENLGSPDYFLREQAQAELSLLGYDAFDALNAARAHDDLEIQKRVQYLLRTLRVEFLSDRDPEEVRGLLSGYESQDQATRRDRIRKLAELSDHAGIPALCRLVRFEPSTILAKEAAQTVLQMAKPAAAEAAVLTERMVHELGSTPRPGAEWVRLGIQAQKDAAAVLSVWPKVVEQEKKWLAKAGQSTPALVLGLLRYQEDLQRQSNHLPEAYATMMSMVELESGVSLTLSRLIDELVTREDWARLEQVGTRFGDRIQQQPRLIYRLAEAQQRMNRPEAAEQMAARARALPAASRTERFRLAHHLLARGLADWAEQEFLVLETQVGSAGDFRLSVDSDTTQVRGILDDYLAKDESLRRDLINVLAALSPPEGLSALGRIVRFEEAEIVAKEAAQAIITQDKVDELSWPEREKTLRGILGKRQRPAADWMRIYLDARKSPRQAAEAWQKQLEAEEKLFASNRQLSSALLVANLRLQAFSCWKRAADLGAAEQVLAAWIEQETGEEETLGKVVDLLLREKSWMRLDQLARKFDKSFDNDALRLYIWSRALTELGQSDAAKQKRDAATALYPEQPEEHWKLAYSLSQRGLDTEAQREYEALIALGPRADLYSLNARQLLAEMLAEREQYEVAVRLMSELHKQLQENPNDRQKLLFGEPAARWHFYQAKLAAQKKDDDKQREALDRAVEADPNDADILIALYRFPKSDDAHRKRTLQFLQDSLAGLRQKIRSEPQNPTHYNHLAWLIGNTEGDQDEALAASLKSLELRPGTGGYLDTLARVYFARHELDKAVRFQREALELDPNSPSLSRQLREFEAALEKSRGDQKD